MHYHNFCPAMRVSVCIPLAHTESRVSDTAVGIYKVPSPLGFSVITNQPVGCPSIERSRRAW